MSASRHVLYVSDVVPGPGYGGQIIVERHLRRLAADGHSVTVIAPFGHPAASGPWRRIDLPARRWWWPPFRPSNSILAHLRAWAWRRELASAGIPRADAVVTVCWGGMSWLACSLAKTSRVPLIAIVHDWWRESGSASDALIGGLTCATASRVFAVSKEMQAALKAECKRDIDLLYPIPAARTLPFSVWREEFRTPSVAHVGSLQPYHEEFLAVVAAQLVPLGGRLLLLCAKDNPTALALVRRCPNLVQHDSFPDNADALRWIAAHASAIAVMYRHGPDASGRPPTGFPSRFVEFAQLGLPVLLAAPIGNPIRAWAQAHAWTGQCDPADAAAIEGWERSLAQPASWVCLAEATRRAAQTEFDADIIHAHFSRALTTG